MKPFLTATLGGLSAITIAILLLLALTASGHRGSGRAELDGRYYSSDTEETDKKRDPRPKVAAQDEPPDVPGNGRQETSTGK